MDFYEYIYKEENPNTKRALIYVEAVSRMLWISILDLVPALVKKRIHVYPKALYLQLEDISGCKKARISVKVEQNRVFLRWVDIGISAVFHILDAERRVNYIRTVLLEYFDCLPMRAVWLDEYFQVIWQNE